ncbi:MAG: GNAT family N-acetyltransferase [Candidatus Helarchaeota archaeon]
MEINYEFFEIDQKNKKGLAQIKRSYKQNFPRKERIRWYKLIKEINPKKISSKDYCCTIFCVKIKQNPEIIIGFSILYYFKNINSGLLSYIAINKKYRNKGIGTKFLLKIKDYFIDIAYKNNFKKPIGFFYEIEMHNLPQYKKTKLKEIIARYRFYSRLNQKIVDTPYLQPAISLLGEDIPMHLMLFRFDNLNFVDYEIIKIVIEAIYRIVYKKSNKKIIQLINALNLENSSGKIKLKSLEPYI